MKKVGKLAILAGTMACFLIGTMEVKADENIETANYSNIGFRSAVLPELTGGVPAGEWQYMYTAEPFAFYRHSITKQWKSVQVTGIFDHTVNVIKNGWISSLAGSYDYATTWGHRTP